LTLRPDILVRATACVLLLAAALVGPLVLNAPASHTWRSGTILYWADGASVTAATIAASRWNDAEVGVRFRPASSRAGAEVVITTDDARLRHDCGRDCFGWTTAIGRPRHGHSDIVLRSSVIDPISPFSVWVVAHEFGHVLGLQHRRGGVCTLMQPQAFVGRCRPSVRSLGRLGPRLRCIPAPADVRAAARLYGGRARAADPRCE
jgi:hypothetical protein